MFVLPIYFWLWNFILNASAQKFIQSSKIIDNTLARLWMVKYGNEYNGWRDALLHKVSWYILPQKESECLCNVLRRNVKKNTSCRFVYMCEKYLLLYRKKGEKLIYYNFSIPLRSSSWRSTKTHQLLILKKDIFTSSQHTMHLIFVNETWTCMSHFFLYVTLQKQIKFERSIWRIVKKYTFDSRSSKCDQ